MYMIAIDIKKVHVYTVGTKKNFPFYKTERTVLL